MSAVGMADPSGELRRRVRRVYVRHQSLSGDLFVPTLDAVTVGELRREASTRLEALGVVMRAGVQVRARPRLSDVAFPPGP